MPAPFAGAPRFFLALLLRFSIRPRIQGITDHSSRFFSADRGPGPFATKAPGFFAGPPFSLRSPDLAVAAVYIWRKTAKTYKRASWPIRISEAVRHLGIIVLCGRIGGFVALASAGACLPILLHKSSWDFNPFWKSPRLFFTWPQHANRITLTAARPKLFDRDRI